MDDVLSDGPDLGESTVNCDQERNASFRYPWIDGATQVRLLKISGSSSTAATIECTLEIADVSKLPDTEYTALSYCWGEARTDQDIHPILVDGQSFWIRTNLAAFLRSCQDWTTEALMYIDAICLNQLDRAERGVQVKLMSQVYSEAACVHVWLGSPPRQLIPALQCLRAQLSNSTPTSEWRADSFVAFSYICSTEYWRRLWVVQELLLSKSASLHCGQFQFTWHELVAYANLSQSDDFSDLPEDVVWWDAWTFSRPRDYARELEITSQLFNGWQSALRLICYRHKWLLRARGENLSIEGFPFHQAVSAFRHQQCLDRKDKVYALIGLLNSEGRQMVAPNYQSSLGDVFVQAAAAAMVSRWRANPGPMDTPALDRAHHMFCDMLNTTLGLSSNDIDVRSRLAKTEAFSYMIGLQAADPDLRRSVSEASPVVTLHDVSHGSTPEPQARDAAIEERPLQQVLAEFCATLTDAEQRDFAATRLSELNITLAAIQNKQRAIGTLQNMRRLKHFLDTADGYAELLDACSGSPNTVNYVWGSIKALLQITVRRPEAFDGLLSLYERLGTSLPSIAHVQALSKETGQQDEIVGVLFQNVFGFHKSALEYFKNAAWQLLFGSQWTKLKDRLGEHIADVHAHRAVVEKESDALELVGARKGRIDNTNRFAEVLGQFQQARREFDERFKAQDLVDVERRRARLFSWLCAPDVAPDHDHLHALRKDNAGSGQWLLRSARFRAWYESQSVSAPFLWITGQPGAGKSVLASLVVEEASKLPDTTTLFFYCKHDDAEKSTFIGMARSILSQLLLQKEALVMSYLFDLATKRGEAILRTIKLAREALTTCLKAVGKTYIIIDGLDECQPPEQQQHISKFWMNYVESSSSQPEPSRCILLSRDDELTRPLFCKLPTIRIQGREHEQDISSYCSNAIAQFEERFKLDVQKKAQILDLVTKRAQGMFLFARVVMRNLSSQLTRDELDHELTQRVFPDGLDDAYSRIVETILVRAPQSRRRHAQRLLALVSCATRPLKWREVQAAISIDMEHQMVNYERHGLTVGSKDLLGALVDEMPNGDITFVHSTVKQYLLKKGHIDMVEEQTSLTKRCLDYFNLPHFLRTSADDHIRSALVTGQYAFMEYAVISWTTHLETPLEASSAALFSPTLATAIEQFFALHWRNPRKRSKPTKRIDELTDHIADLPIYAQIRDSMSSTHCLMSTNLSDMEPVQTSHIYATIARVRSLMEDIALEPRDATALKEFYGENLYKCPRVYCKWFHEGFATADARRSHMEKHERSHYCASAGCVYATLGFPTAKELAKHVTEVHSSAMTEEDFPDEVDDEPAPEINALTEVDKTPPPVTHSTTTEPSNAEKTVNRTPTAAANPERRQKPAEPVRQRRKGPTTFHCELCPKRFTRAFGLKSHMRAHTDDRRFVCSVCGKGFNRQRDCKRHEELHSGEKKYVCYGPLQRGGHWGCNKKFARLDALNRHFRSEAGRACIQPLEDEEAHEKRRQQQSQHRDFSMSSSYYDPSRTLPLPHALLQQYPALTGANSGSAFPSQSHTPDPFHGRTGMNDSHLTNGLNEYEGLDMDYEFQPQPGPSDYAPGGSLHTPYYPH